MSAPALSPSLESPSPPRAKTARLDYLEAGYLVVFATLVATGWLALTLAELGIYRPVVVLGLAACGLAVGAVVVLRRPWRHVDPGSIGGLVLPLAAGVALFFPPDEWILGDLDPGSYVNAGALIARTGAIASHDPVLAALDPSVHAALFQMPASRLPGLYLTRANWQGLLPHGWVIPLDRVVPHGFHLFPVVLSFGWAVGGIRAELLVPPVLALLGLAGFYLLARRLFGTGVASVAALLLAISPAEIWFARYPAAELLVQVLVFGSMLAFVAALDAPGRDLYLLAGAGLGAAHLAKIELLPVPFLVAAFFAFQALRGRFDRRWLWFLGVYLALLVQAVVHAAIFADWYAATTFEKALSSHLTLAALAAVVALSLASALGSWRSDRVRRALARSASWPGWDRAVPLVVPLAIGLFGLYAYYVRPLASLPLVQLPAGALRDAAIDDLQSFPRLGWYVTPLGLLLGTLGWMLIVHRERGSRALLPLLLIAADTVLFLDHLDITPIHYWAARRWVTLVIPGVFLATAYLLTRLVPAERKRRFEGFVPLALGLVLAVGLLGLDRPLLGYVEYRGAVDQLGALAARVPANGVVFFPETDAGWRFSTPLNYLYDRTSFLVPPDPAGAAGAATAARAFARQGHPVYWITTTDQPGPSAIGLGGTVVARLRVSLPEKLAVSDRRPGEDGLFQQDLEIWKIAEAGG